MLPWLSDNFTRQASGNGTPGPSVSCLIEKTSKSRWGPFVPWEGQHLNNGIGQDGCFQFTSDHCDGGIGRLEMDLVKAIRVEADLVVLVVGVV
jgi:hypothetical protein